MRASRNPCLLAAFAAIYLIWGTTFLAIKVVVSHLPPFLMAGLRSLAAGAILLAWARFRGTPWPGERVWAYGLAAGALMFLAGHGTLFWAFSAYLWLLKEVSPTAVASYAYVNPVVALVVGAALGGERITVETLLPVGAILAAVILIIAGEAGRLTSAAVHPACEEGAS